MSDPASTLSPAAVAALRNHPGFHAAAREAARSLIPMYRADRFLNALMSDRARAVFAHVALFLHYRGTANGEPGLTVGAMKDMCASWRSPKNISPGCDCSITPQTLGRLQNVTPA